MKMEALIFLKHGLNINPEQASTLTLNRLVLYTCSVGKRCWVYLTMSSRKQLFAVCENSYPLSAIPIVAAQSAANYEVRLKTQCLRPCDYCLRSSMPGCAPDLRRLQPGRVEL